LKYKIAYYQAPLILYHIWKDLILPQKILLFGDTEYPWFERIINPTILQWCFKTRREPVKKAIVSNESLNRSLFT
jgi:hypothetical protein